MVSPTPGSVWLDTETGERVEVDSFDGAYAVVTGEHGAPGRGTTHSGKPNAFMISASHFGTTMKLVSGLIPRSDYPELFKVLEQYADAGQDTEFVLPGFSRKASDGVDQAEEERARLPEA